jgi:prevent-host-death family protein
MSVREISIAEAKARLSELVNRVAYGRERIIITKRGKPIAILSAPSGKGLSAVKGWLQGQDVFFREVRAIEKKRHRRRLRAVEKTR